MPVDKFGRSSNSTISGGICPSSTGGNLKILNYNGHIPPIPANNDSNYTGFRPYASSEQSTNPAVFAFNPMNVSNPREIVYGWISSVRGVGSWLQINCPTAVRIWKVRLRSANSNIHSWKISGAGDELVFTDLLTSNARFIYQDRKPQDFSVDSIVAYKIYRFTVLGFDGSPDGDRRTCVSHFQIFTYFKDGDSMV